MCGQGPAPPEPLEQEGPCEAGPGVQPALDEECSCPAVSALPRVALLSLSASDLCSAERWHWLLELPWALLAV